MYLFKEGFFFLKRYYISFCNGVQREEPQRGVNGHYTPPPHQKKKKKKLTNQSITGSYR